MQTEEFLLINKKALPEVYSGVVRVKELIAGKGLTTLEAVKEAGISRSAFYKYKDYVFKYTEDGVRPLNLTAVLNDKAGVFSALTAELYKYGANILTINQSMPTDGIATVSLVISIKNLEISLETLLNLLEKVEGVVSIKKIS